jgi:transcriptional regulator with XRE-family HTH domain
MIRPMPQNRLRSLRREYGLTVEQVSNATGLSFSTLYAIDTTEREVTPSTAFSPVLRFAIGEYLAAAL